MTASLRELLYAGVRGAPGRVVITGAGREVTWRSLHGTACQIASALVRDGVSAQDRVVFVGKNDPGYFDVLFGCALAAAVPVPLNWRLTPGELATMINDSGAAVVFVDQASAAAIEQVEDRLPHVRTIVALDSNDRWPSLAAWRGPAEDPGVAAEPGHVAFQLYTSGTTGAPKGAMFANGTSLRVLLDDISVQWGFTGRDVSLVCMPLFHMGGLAWALAGLARGARAVVVRDFAPAPVLDLIQEAGITVAFCVPTMLSALIAVPGAVHRPLSLQRMVYSGSPISPAALRAAQAALRCDFVQIYGLTEATGAFAQLSAAEHRAADRTGLLSSAGRPYPWVEVRIVAPQNQPGQGQQDLAAGQIGEIWTRSEQNMLGYWHRPEETASALTGDGWLRTGDLGYLDDQGRIYLVDRAKDMIISGGENVYPAEVEKVLAAHPSLADVAVIGVPDDRWGETVKAIVVAQSGTVVDPAGVIAFARARLAGFKCPTSVDLVDTLPRTATGKVVKPALRERYWQGHDRRIN